MSSQLLIIYHSRTGGTQQMAEAAANAARTEVATRLIKAEDAEPGDLLCATGYIFAAPENLASVSGVMKDFFDRCYYPLLERIEGRPYALMVCAGSDGQGAVRQMSRIATGWRLNVAQMPLIVHTNAQSMSDILAPKTLSASDLAPCAALGQALGAGLTMGVF